MLDLEGIGGAIDSPELEDNTYVPGHLGAVTVSSKNWPLSVPGGYSYELTS
jgi:hypothetical protein